LITIGKGIATTIHASSTSTTTTGNVFIALGTVPTASTVAAGTPPSANPPTLAGPTQNLITYGTTALPTGSITTSAGDVFTSTFRNLSFTTGKNAATQIVVGGNVQIIADPPANVVSQTIEPKVLAASSNNVFSSLAVPPAVAATPAPLVHTLQQNPAGGSIAIFAAIGGPNPAITAGDITESIYGALTDTLSTTTSGINSKVKSGEIAATAFPVVTGDRAGAASNDDPIYRDQGRSILNRSVVDRCVLDLSTVDSTDPDTDARDTSVPAALTGQVSNVHHQTLNSGASLFAPHQDTVVETPFGSVSIAGNSIVLVIAAPDNLAVYDLHDMHKNSVVIRCVRNHSAVQLTPGRSVVFTKIMPNWFENVNPAQKVRYKNVTKKQIGEHQVYQGEFEITSMVQCLAPLRDMFHSYNPAMRKVAGHMIKTAVILSQLSGGEPYRFFAAPEVTASLPKPNN